MTKRKAAKPVSKTETITVTLRDLVNAKNAMMQVLSLRPGPTTAVQLARAGRQIDPELQTFWEQRRKLVEEYGERLAEIVIGLTIEQKERLLKMVADDPELSAIIAEAEIEPGGRWRVLPENRETFNEKVKELESCEATLTLPQLDASALGDDVTGQTLLELWFLFDI